MVNIASWIWVLIPLAAIGVVPFKMWLRVKERQIESQSSLAAEKSAQYAQHVERIGVRVGAEKALRLELARDVPHQEPADRHPLARVMPKRRA